MNFLHKNEYKRRLFLNMSNINTKELNIKQSSNIVSSDVEEESNFLLT